MSPMGMLIQKIDRQPTEVTSTPPTTGPSAMDTPTTAAQTPMAWARSRGIGEGVGDDRHGHGIQHRPAHGLDHAEDDEQRQGWGPGCRAASRPTKVTSPMTKVRRRPSRSAVDPESMSRLASTRV